MNMVYKFVIKPYLFGLEAEEAHDLTYQFARDVTENVPVLSILSKIFRKSDERLMQNIWGLNFENPVGLAAGFDKNGWLPHAMYALGFGFTEIGSITAERSDGNAKPRLFRLPDDGALVNRMGLNNDGAVDIISRLGKMQLPDYPVGINIAKTHNPLILGSRAVQDYLFSYRLAQTLADYITINISCPNTEEGKTFEDPVALRELLDTLLAKKITAVRKIPVLVKLSADLAPSQLDVLLSLCEEYHVDGYVISNTSSTRENIVHTAPSLVKAMGRGGLSGKPVFSKSLNLIRHASSWLDTNRPIIGVGGITKPEDAIEMIKSGAWLVQVYTGLVYEGIELPLKINRAISKFMKVRGLSTLEELRRSGKV